MLEKGAVNQYPFQVPFTSPGSSALHLRMQHWLVIWAWPGSSEEGTGVCCLLCSLWQLSSPEGLGRSQRFSACFRKCCVCAPHIVWVLGYFSASAGGEHLQVRLTYSLLCL